MSDERAPAAPALATVTTLCEALEGESIDWCHWKSTTAIGRSATGENDLDLLVRREHASRCAEVLRRTGFRPARGPAREELPGVVNWYAWDEAADRFVHAHVHHRLVVGDDRTKNHRLPLEEAFLRTARRDGLFRVPEPELELIMLVLRLVLKYRTWEQLPTRRRKLPQGARRELDDLQARTERARVEELLERELPFVGVELFDSCSRALRPDCPIGELLAISGRLHRALRSQARRPPVPELVLRLGRRLAGGLRRRFGRRGGRKRLLEGGALIVVSGAGDDVLEDLRAWLARELDVSVVPLARPRPSWTTRLVGAWARPDEGEEDGGAGLRRAAWAACAARDRRRAYCIARRRADGGALVLSDEWPRAAPADTPDDGLAGRLRRSAVRAAAELRPADVTLRLHEAAGLPSWKRAIWDSL